ncbi:hypothetical protein [Marimonas arenosa]|uniref:Uncharacterized protein n=1 Tax=Marimonas arenosa TaxID=1795305 RepID=A0AAE4B450_9RHOB|nr:hypothetical protein [Marimonas arenosa]MDQ2089870.1 hypothetical protein [Marimonas arenosa]
MPTVTTFAEDDETQRRDYRPQHPLALNTLQLRFHAVFQPPNPVVSCSGLEQLIAKGKKMEPVGDFFHQLYHRYFACRRGRSWFPFDKWIATFNEPRDGSSAATDRPCVHKKQIYTR